MTVKTSPEYEQRVHEELVRACEELRSIHEGSTEYLHWLQLTNEPMYLQLGQMSDAVRRAVGVLPVEVIAALLDVYVSIHRFYFTAWKSKTAIGVEYLSHLVAANRWPV